MLTNPYSNGVCPIQMMPIYPPPPSVMPMPEQQQQLQHQQKPSVNFVNTYGKSNKPGYKSNYSKQMNGIGGGYNKFNSTQQQQQQRNNYSSSQSYQQQMSQQMGYYNMMAAAAAAGYPYQYMPMPMHVHMAPASMQPPLPPLAPGTQYIPFQYIITADGQTVPVSIGTYAPLPLPPQPAVAATNSTTAYSSNNNTNIDASGAITPVLDRII